MLRAVGSMLLILAVVPGVGAHATEGSLNHISPTFGNLAPGETRSFHATFEDGDFVEGWVFLIYGRAIDPTGGAASLNVTFGQGGLDAARWRWASGDFRLNTTGIPATTEYDIGVHNPNPHNMSYIFYFDQSCDCLAKPITLPGGVVIFNYPFREGERFSFGIPTLGGWRIHAELATRLRETSLWPSDFQILSAAAKDGKGWLYLNGTAEVSAEHYFYVRADEGVTFSLEPDEVRVVDITPLVERPKESPGFGVAALLFVGALAWGMRRRS